MFRPAPLVAIVVAAFCAVAAAGFIAAPAVSAASPSDARYTVLDPPIPAHRNAGGIEVTEVFWYHCPACNALEPQLAQWERAHAGNVTVVRVPVLWRPRHRVTAQLYYTLEALGRLDLHSAVFEEIHKNHVPLDGTDVQAVLAEQLAFARRHGIDEKAFLSAYGSEAVKQNLQRAEQLTKAYRISGVPSMIVNGKYATNVEQAGGNVGLLTLVDQLVQREKSK